MYVHQCEYYVSRSKCLLSVNVIAPVSFYICGVTKTVFNATTELPLIKLYVHVQ